MFFLDFVQENCSQVTFLQNRILRRIVFGFLSLLSFFYSTHLPSLLLKNWKWGETSLCTSMLRFFFHHHFLKFINKNHALFFTWLLSGTWGQTLHTVFKLWEEVYPVILLYSAIFIPRILVIFGRKLFHENMFKK